MDKGKPVTIIVTHWTVYRSDQDGETHDPPFLAKPARPQSICQEVNLKRLSHLNMLELVGIIIDDEPYATVVPCRGFRENYEVS